MKNKLILLQILAILVWAPVAGARSTMHQLSIQDAMQTPDAVEKLNKGISFYFGAQEHPDTLRSFGEFTANKKTNAFNKSDIEACQWVFLSAMLALQDRAIKEGGNAVINIVSYYQKKELASKTEFECAAGAVVAGTALRGEVVTIKE